MTSGIQAELRCAVSAVGLLTVFALVTSSHAVEKKKSPPGAAVYNWAGCYVGGNAGWIGSDSAIRQYPSGSSLNTGFQADRDARTASVDFSNSGFAGGGQIGCNWQPQQNWVYGVETDFNGTTLNETRGFEFAEMPLPSNPAATLVGFNSVMTHKMPWFGTVRGRIGYAFDRTLIYATGGLAYGHVEATYTNTSQIGSYTTTRIGWTAGGGIEEVLPDNWSVKVEYLYLDLGKFSYDAPYPPAPIYTWGQDVTTRAHIVRLGLNYKFVGPTVSKH